MKTGIGSTLLTVIAFSTYLSRGLIAQPLQSSQPNPIEMRKAMLAAAGTSGPPKAALAGESESTLQATPDPSKASGRFQIFDAPGAVNLTYPYAINLLGAITGFYNDANGAGHGFLRYADGRIITFDAPGAGTGSYQGTFAYAINDLGVITGYYCDVNFNCPGFVRDSNGKFTVFDAPNDVNGTYPSGINLEGSITGFSLDANLLYHGFVRTSGGTLTVFDGPDAGTGLFFKGTSPADINLAGKVSGCYFDANYKSHGFVRDNNGTLTTFDGPGASTGLWCNNYESTEFGLSSEGLGISLTGSITGSYFETIAGTTFGGNYRGFLRSPDGTFRTFDAVASPSSPCCTWTFGIAINLAGAIAGFDNDSNNVNHGFVRTSEGSVMLLDAPGAGTGPGQGTVANGINIFGWVTGSYKDSTGARHGFLWTPSFGANGEF